MQKNNNKKKNKKKIEMEKDREKGKKKNVEKKLFLFFFPYEDVFEKFSASEPRSAFLYPSRYGGRSVLHGSGRTL